MATKAKLCLHRREKSTSIPSSPQIIKANHGRRMSVDSRIDTDIPTLQKSLPNYLKPTISSGLNKSRSANSEKAAKTSPSSPKSTGSPRSIRDKASEISKAVRIPKSMIRNNGSMATGPEEKVITVDIGSKRDAENSPRTPRGQFRSTKRVHVGNRDNEGMIDKGSGGTLAGEERLTRGKGSNERPRARRAKSSSTVDGKGEETSKGNEGGNKEEDNKLAKRTSKVAALVGAFETVMSLQEPDSVVIEQQEVGTVMEAKGIEGDGVGMVAAIVG